jgi:tape measure domain-containing protein
MSNDTARFGLELLDKVSGPAERIVGGLEGATGALEKLGSTSGAASGGMTKVGRAAEIMTVGLRGLQIVGAAVDLTKSLGGIEGLRSGILRTGQALRRFGSWAAVGLKRIAPFAVGGAGLYGLGKIASSVAVPAMGAAAVGIGAVGLAAGGAAVAVGLLGFKLAGLAAGGLKAAGEFAVFGQNTRLAFNALAKHGASGDKLFQHVRGMADEYGMSVIDATKNYKGLLGAGFTPRMADDITKMSADMRFLGATAEETKGAVRAISQIKAAGRLQGDELNQLAEAGIGAGGVYDALAKRLGKTTAEVMKLKEAGKIDSSTAIAGIFDAVLAKTGSEKLGDRGKEWANSTVDGFLSRIKAKGQNLMVDIGDRLLPTLHRLTHGAFQWVEAFIQSGRADEVVRSMGRTFEAVGSALVTAAPLADRFLKGFGSGAAQAFDALARAVTAFGKGDPNALGDAFEKVGAGLSKIVVYGSAAVAALGAAAGAVGTLAYYISPFSILDRVEAFYGFGKDIVFGIARGIRDAAYSVVDAIGGVADAAVNKLRSTLDMRSPSKVFGELGAYTAMGFAVGISSHAGLAADASRDMGLGAASATAQASPALGAVSGSAGAGGLDIAGIGSGSVVHFSLTQHIDGSGLDANEVASLSARESRRAVEDFFRSLGREG